MYTPAFLLLRCGIYVSQEHLYCDIQAELIGLVFNKRWPIRRAMVVVIILLHALITMNVAADWSYIHSAFIDNGQSFWTVHVKLTSAAQSVSWELGITASMSTILADLYMVCTTRLRSSTLIHFRFYSRFGGAGWFGDSAGLLFCFLYCP